MKLYILRIINHKNGSNVYAFTTREKLFDGLDVYVKFWWDKDDLPPEKQMDRIDEYFANHTYVEDYEITPVTLDERIKCD